MKSKDKNSYVRHAEDILPKSKIALNCLRAFLTGGLICAIGQGIYTVLFNVLGVPEESSRTLLTVIMIFLGGLFTALGIYDDIGKFAGAGSIVPITGFANSVVSPAMEFRQEGYVFGVGAKMFTIAGPVIVYGTAAAVIYGVIYWVATIIR
ncbi:MAG: stage V sporulation protein AC [Clostridiales bacterium]|nr:stage V sporulation protein AC [Clostridiales bacterium]